MIVSAFKQVDRPAQSRLSTRPVCLENNRVAFLDHSVSQLVAHAGWFVSSHHTRFRGLCNSFTI